MTNSFQYRQGTDSFGLVNVVSRIPIVLMEKGFSRSKQTRQKRSQNPVPGRSPHKGPGDGGHLFPKVKFVSVRSK